MIKLRRIKVNNNIILDNKPQIIILDNKANILSWIKKEGFWGMPPKTFFQKLIIYHI